MIRRCLFCLLPGVLCFLVSCGSKSLVFTEPDNGRAVNLSIDDEFEVRLACERNFKWIRVPLKGGPVRFENETAAEAEKGRISYVFKFKTVSAGDVVLKFVKVPSAASGPPPENLDAFTLNVMVGTMGRIMEE